MDNQAIFLSKIEECRQNALKLRESNSEDSQQFKDLIEFFTLTYQHHHDRVVISAAEKAYKEIFHDYVPDGPPPNINFVDVEA